MSGPNPFPFEDPDAPLVTIEDVRRLSNHYLINSDSEPEATISNRRLPGALCAYLDRVVSWFRS